MSLNRSIIMGRLTADPEIKKTGSGVSVCSFTLAVDQDYKPKDAERGVDWIDCVAWRQTADFLGKYFSKGRMVVVEGRLQTRTYEDKDGNKRKATELVADNVYFGDSKRDGNNSTQSAQEPAAGQSAEVTGDDDDLPF